MYNTLNKNRDFTRILANVENPFLLVSIYLRLQYYIKVKLESIKERTYMSDIIV